MALSTYCKMGALENLSSEAELLSYSSNFDLHPLYHEDQQVLPYLSSQWDPLNISLSEILTVPQDFDTQSSYYYPKRQKCYGNEYNFSDFTPTLFDGFLPPMPDSYHVECSRKMMNERSVSAQSIAARERRRKISEKTQELGRLIPGGNRMNTAEMFHAASKYLKFLQAQLGILQLMPSIIFQVFS